MTVKYSFYWFNEKHFHWFPLRERRDVGGVQRDGSSRPSFINISKFSVIVWRMVGNFLLKNWCVLSAHRVLRSELSDTLHTFWRYVARSVKIWGFNSRRLSLIDQIWSNGRDNVTSIVVFDVINYLVSRLSAAQQWFNYGRRARFLVLLLDVRYFDLTKVVRTLTR